MPTDLASTAQALLAAGRVDEAVALVAHAAGQGDPAALHLQGMWRLIGSPLPRDLPQARQALRRAAEAGHPDARLIDIALTGNGGGAPADWPRALALLRETAFHDSHAAQQLELVEAMALDDVGEPRISLPVEDLTPGGTVRRSPRLLTPAECAHVAHSAADLLAPAFVVDPRTGRNVPHPVRTSDAAVIGPLREDLVIRAINQRLATVSGTTIGQGEALTVLRYNPGQQFRLHSDAIPGARNQRVSTVLVYLNDGFAGGETTFPDYALTIAPRTGDAIIFRNVRADGSADPQARHAGLPVRNGVKWLATRWIRARPFDVWTGPEQA